jgi:hypothetical protein
MLTLSDLESARQLLGNNSSISIKCTTKNTAEALPRKQLKRLGCQPRVLHGSFIYPKETLDPGVNNE